jgi:GTP pyrophosphokinase
MHAVAPTTTPYAQALARLPAGALPAPLAAFWRDRAEAGAPMRDRADVLLDTLAILTLNADAEVMAAALLDALVDIEPLAAEAKIEIPERLQPRACAGCCWPSCATCAWCPSCWRGNWRGCARPGRLPAAERRALAQLTRDIHAPLANRLGIWQLKWELEDLAFRYLEPETYVRIARLLDETAPAANASSSRCWPHCAGRWPSTASPPRSRPAEAHLQHLEEDAEEGCADRRALRPARGARAGGRRGRPATPCSAWCMRCGCPSRASSTTTSPGPSRNGYRSLHTAVIGPEGKTLEVQIRTREMHAQAELGVAAHWRYKEGSAAGGAAMLRRKIAWMRKLLEQAADAAKDGEASPAAGLDATWPRNASMR